MLRAFRDELVFIAKLTGAEEYQISQYQKGTRGLKNLAPAVRQMSRAGYECLYPPVGRVLLDKADGERAFVSVHDGRARVLSAEYKEESASGDIRLTVVDGELVHSVLYVFDVIAVNGAVVADQGFESRVNYLAEAASVLTRCGIEAQPKPAVRLGSSSPKDLEAAFKDSAFKNRPYNTDGWVLVESGQPYRLTTAHKWKPLDHMTIDFLARRAPESALGQTPFVDAPGCQLHFLFVGVNPELRAATGLHEIPAYGELFGDDPQTRPARYAPIQFSPPDAPLAYLYQHPVEAGAIDGKVVELLRRGPGASAGPPTWEFIRVREDRARELASKKYFGNDMTTAIWTWLNLSDPFDEHQLWEGPAPGYFAAPKPKMYDSQTALTSYVKSQRIGQHLTGASWVVDLAVGKGQDLGRYRDSRVRNLVGVDNDASALAELTRRQLSLAQEEQKARRAPPTGQGRWSGRGNSSGRGRWPRRGNSSGRGSAPGGRPQRDHAPATALHTCCTDLAASYAQSVNLITSAHKFPFSGADGIVCNLGVHYFAGGITEINNFVMLCKGLIRMGGVVIITAMFGERVHDLLIRHKVPLSGSWDSRHQGKLKYSIRRKYDGDSLEPAGQQVDVLLPFSRGEYYSEYLVNTETLVAEFTANGFQLLELSTFDEHFNDFRCSNPRVYNNLTPEDLSYLGLYGEVVFCRKGDR